jgi:predicted HTH transcriptional regulator
VDASILLKYDADELTLLMVVEGRDIPYAAGEAHPVKVIWNEEYQDVFALDGVEFEETVSITMKKGATSDSNKQKVLDALKSSGEWMSKKEIEMATGFSKDTVSRHLNHLVEDGTVHLDPDASGPGKASKYQAT